MIAPPPQVRHNPTTALLVVACLILWPLATLAVTHG